MTPHKHAALIKAWADGAQIQYRVKLHDIGQEAWYDSETPHWHRSDIDFRIKPAEKVVRWQWIWRNALGAIYVPTDMLTEQEIEKHENKKYCLGKAEWSRMEFDK